MREALGRLVPRQRIRGAQGGGALAFHVCLGFGEGPMARSFLDVEMVGVDRSRIVAGREGRSLMGVEDRSERSARIGGGRIGRGRRACST
jgi:hypothetical protein